MQTGGEICAAPPHHHMWGRGVSLAPTFRVPSRRRTDPHRNTAAARRKAELRADAHEAAQFFNADMRRNATRGGAAARGAAKPKRGEQPRICAAADERRGRRAAAPLDLPLAVRRGLYPAFGWMARPR